MKFKIWLYIWSGFVQCMFHSYKKLVGVVDDNDASRENSIVIGKLSGSGGFGQVFEARYNGHVCAVKKIKNRRTTRKGMSRKDVDAEVKYMQMLHHPNILRLLDAFLSANKKTFYVITELCAGGDVFDAYAAGKIATPSDIIRITRDVLSAIMYMHDQRMMHRDIKPENVMLQHAWPVGEPVPRAKLIDFGLARTFTKGERFYNPVGTPSYMAPEVFAQNYTEKCDEWSIGIFLFILVEGYWPFGGPETPIRELSSIVQTKTNIFEDTEYNWDDWPTAKDLVTRLLDKNGETRMTARQALDHPFITEVTFSEPVRVDNKLASFRLREFVHINKIKRLFRYKIAQQLTYSDKKRYEREFGDGIHSMTLGAARKKMHEYHFTDEEIAQVFEHLDVTNNNSWDISEFVAGVMSDELYNTMAAFEKAFASIDTNGDKQLDRDELVAVVGEADAEEIMSDFGGVPIGIVALKNYFKSTMETYAEPHAHAVLTMQKDEAVKTQVCSIQ